jgi:hypothetical protein
MQIFTLGDPVVVTHGAHATRRGLVRQSGGDRNYIVDFDVCGEGVSKAGLSARVSAQHLRPDWERVGSATAVAHRCAYRFGVSSGNATQELCHWCFQPCDLTRKGCDVSFCSRVCSMHANRAGHLFVCNAVRAAIPDKHLAAYAIEPSLQRPTVEATIRTLLDGAPLVGKGSALCGVIGHLSATDITYRWAIHAPYALHRPASIEDYVEMFCVMQAAVMSATEWRKPRGGWVDYKPRRAFAMVHVHEGRGTVCTVDHSCISAHGDSENLCFATTLHAFALDARGSVVGAFSPVTRSDIFVYADVYTMAEQCAAASRCPMASFSRASARPTVGEFVRARDDPSGACQRVFGVDKTAVYVGGIGSCEHPHPHARLVIDKVLRVASTELMVRPNKPLTTAPMVAYQLARARLASLDVYLQDYTATLDHWRGDDGDMWEAIDIVHETQQGETAVYMQRTYENERGFAWMQRFLEHDDMLGCFTVSVVREWSSLAGFLFMFGRTMSVGPSTCDAEYIADIGQMLVQTTRARGAFASVE